MIASRAALLCPLLCVVWLGCGPPLEPDLGPRVPRELTPTQAHLVISQALSSAGFLTREDVSVQLEGLGEKRVDFVFAGERHGIEWLTAQERSSLPDAPPPTTGGDPLRTLQGTVVGAGAIHVLWLDARAYLYESNGRWVQRGAPGIDSVEERLRGDVLEFLDYVAGEDPPI